MDNQSLDSAPEESGDYLVSLADLLAGLLFIFMIILMVFVLSFQGATRELADTKHLQSEMLQQISQELAKRGVQVILAEGDSVLRLTENEVLFPSGSAELSSEDQAHLAVIGDVLQKILICHAGLADSAPALGCSNATPGHLEAVFVEGHTDNMPIWGGKFEDNWVLSSQRALSTYRALLRTSPGLAVLTNQRGQPLFSVSGYGEGRPVIAHATPTPEIRNRRIDLRFLMVPPSYSVLPPN